MNQLKSLSKTCEEIYNNKGQTAVFDHINKIGKKKLDSLKVAYEFCKACNTESPSQNHNCLVCGQLTE